MPNPTRQEIIDAHDALTHLINGGIACTYTRAAKEGVYECEKLIRKFLPPKPQPTMAEVEWDDELHYLAEAEHLQFGKVIMLYKNSAADSIEVIYKNQDGITPSITYPGALTPTGRRYTLTEVQE